MFSLFNRLFKDLTRTGGHIAGLGMSTFVLSVIATYLAIFAVPSVLTTPLDGNAPAEEVSFLRVIDPHATMFGPVESPKQGTQIGGAGVRSLFEIMEQDHRLVFVETVGGIYSPGSSSFRDPEAVIVMGIDPPFLPSPRTHNQIDLWIGSDGSQTAGDQMSISGIPVIHQPEDILPVDYVLGSGHARSTAGSSVYAMGPTEFDSIFDLNTQFPTEFLRSVTCYCSTSELKDVADSMTRAETEAGTNRIFYAVDYTNVRGELGLSVASENVWVIIFSASFIGAFAGLIIMIGQVLWNRQKIPYRVDRLHGASQKTLQLRFQIQMVLAFTIPAISGFLLVHVGVGNADFPPPFSDGTTRAVILSIAAVQLLATVPAIKQINQMSNYSNGILR